jgi:hypothetical protein
MEIDRDSVKNYANFEVNKILDDKDCYVSLLGIYWVFGNDTILNMK